MSANIEALVKKHIDRDGWSLAPDGEVASAIRNALTEQAEAFKGELQAYDGMVRELTKTVEDMRAAQAVPVVGDVVAWVQYRDHSGMRPTTIHLCDSDSKGAFEVIRKPTHSIPAAELASLREKAAMADELQKRAERMQKALSDIAEWTDRYTTPGHPVSTIASAAIAQEKGE